MYAEFAIRVGGGMPLFGAAALFGLQAMTVPRAGATSAPPGFAEHLRAIVERRDQASFAALFDYYGPRVKAYLKRLGATDGLAEDIVQEAMLTVWRKAESYDPSKAQGLGIVILGAGAAGFDLFGDAGFGDVPAPPTVQSRPAEIAAKVTPAEILSKPTPIYTEEARSKKIEGEVLLEVVLEASGKIRVLKVVRGLGHGLDEAATRAAQQIKYKPALSNGHAVDFPAVVHIVFQTAS